MHLIQIVRHYLGLSQKELAQKAGITQPDLCEMEIKEPYGRIDKYKRLSEYLGIPVHALVTNDCRLIPETFFERHTPKRYTEKVAGSNLELGRGGEDTVLQMEQELNVYDFRELRDTREITPATYLCNTAPKEPVISGITYCREKCGMSKGELADCLGIKTPHLWRYENGVQKCSVGVYQKMANIMGVMIDQLLEEHHKNVNFL